VLYDHPGKVCFCMAILHDVRVQLSAVILAGPWKSALVSENPPHPQFEEFKIEKGEMFTRLPGLGEHGLGGRHGMDGRP